MVKKGELTWEEGENNQNTLYAILKELKESGGKLKILNIFSDNVTHKQKFWWCVWLI